MEFSSKNHPERDMLGSHAYHLSIMPWLTPEKRAKESAHFQPNILCNQPLFNYLFLCHFNYLKMPCQFVYIKIDLMQLL